MLTSLGLVSLQEDHGYGSGGSHSSPLPFGLVGSLQPAPDASHSRDPRAAPLQDMPKEQDLPLEVVGPRSAGGRLHLACEPKSVPEGNLTNVRDCFPILRECKRRATFPHGELHRQLRSVHLGESMQLENAAMGFTDANGTLLKIKTKKPFFFVYNVNHSKGNKNSSAGKTLRRQDEVTNQTQG